MFKVKLLFLAHVLCPVITTDEAYDSGAISTFYDGIFLKGGHAIIVKIVSTIMGLGTKPWGHPVFMINVFQLLVPKLTECGLSVRKSMIHLQREVCSSSALNLSVNLV